LPLLFWVMTGVIIGQKSRVYVATKLAAVKLLMASQMLRVSLNCSVVNIKSYIRVCLMIGVSCMILRMAWIYRCLTRVSHQTIHHIFQIKDIKHAVSKLKPNEGVCSSVLTSDRFFNAGNDFILVILLYMALSLTAFFQVWLYQFPKAIMQMSMTAHIFEVLLSVLCLVKYLTILF